MIRGEHPGVRIELELVDDPEDSLREVAQGRADLALVVVERDRTRDRTRDGIALAHLLDDPFAAVLPKGHPLAAQRVLDLPDLADEPWVASERPGHCLDPLLDACGAAGFSPNFAVRSEDYATAQGFVAAGLGIGAMPLLGLGNRHPEVVVRRLRNPEPIRAIHAAIRDPSPGQPALHGLLAALRGAASP
ncbi:LysR substrate-binding domain-containing protein [Streptomyces sp. NPDC007861]|uniref:LysR substrate-binding domain-containing protein n=1 Tax=Streptomyces sp. NPDC007861 TaxID=3154893 RepID=UPI0034040F7C